jgi:ABC-2 type transport system permease protein
MRHSYDRLTDTFYWITLDVFVWGMTSLYFQRGAENFQNLVFTIMGAVVLWNMVMRSQNDFSGSLLEELWNKNLVNIFVSPLTFWEWITSLVGLGAIKGLVSFLYASILVALLYQVNIFEMSYYLPIFIVLLYMSGWTLGFLVSGVILRLGTKVQTFSWTIIWLLSPLSAIYFPVSILPEWAQLASRAVPTSYVFEQMRSLLQTGRVDTTALIICFLLNTAYITLALVWLRRSFDVVLKKGLVKVY